jgi:hypothetical protein
VCNGKKENYIYNLVQVSFDVFGHVWKPEEEKTENGSENDFTQFIMI